MSQNFPPQSRKLLAQAAEVADMLTQLQSDFGMGPLNDLIVSWLARGVNLALAEPFVKMCVDSMADLQISYPPHAPDWHSNLVDHLLKNSTRLLKCQ